MRIRRLVNRLPIRAKLTLAYSTVIAVMLGGVGLFLYLNFEEGLNSGLDDTLRTRADDVGALLRLRRAPAASPTDTTSCPAAT